MKNFKKIIALIVITLFATASFAQEVQKEENKYPLGFYMLIKMDFNGQTLPNPNYGVIQASFTGSNNFIKTAYLHELELIGTNLNGVRTYKWNFNFNHNGDIKVKVQTALPTYLGQDDTSGNFYYHHYATVSMFMN